LSAILLVFIGMTAQAQQQLTVGTSEHGTVTFTVGGATVTEANTGDNVNVVIAPAPKGWQVDKVTATAYTSWGAAEARSTMPTELRSVKVVAVSGQWQFTMPAYNVRVDVTYKKTSMSDVTIAAIPDQTYTGFQIKPTPEVKDGTTVLTAGTDFTYEYGENLNVATGGTVTVKAAEGSGFTGSKTVNFNIVPKSINAANVTVDAIAAQPYTGSQITPAVVVKDGDRSVTLGTADYTVSYGENINVATGGTVTVTGKGNYKDSRNVAFRITKVAPAVTQAPTGKPDLVYNATAQDLVNGGTATGGKIEYSTDGGATWSETVPQKTNANENGYSVQWRVTGDANHNNTAPQTIIVPIQRASLTSLELTPASFTYDGTQKKPAETVKAGGLTVPSSGYTISGNTGTDAKEYTAKVTGTGNFKGTVEKKWTIGTADISNADDFAASLSPATYVYDGTEKKPAVTVTRKSDNATLAPNTDYTVAYSNNINVGNNTAKATVTGKGNYKGTRELTFSITNLALTSVTVEPASLTYNGTEQTVRIKEVKAGSITLTAADYEVVSGQKGTNVGEYTLTVKAKDGSNYAGQATTKWNITALSIANATVTLNPTTYTYDGTAKTPAATVKVGSLTLTAGTDFGVTYRDNVNAGTATATITGKGNFTGTTSKTFTISQADLTSVTVKNSPLTYNGKQQTVLVDKVMAGSLTVPATGYTVNSGTDKGTNVGEYTIQVSGKGNFKGTATAKWNIVAASITGAVVTLNPTEYTYDGTEKKPTATVKVTLDGTEYTLVKGTDYEVSYQNNVQAGTAKAVITGKGNYKDSAEKDFTIKKSSGTVAVTPTTWTVTYGDGAQTQQLTLTPTDLTTVQWLSGNTAVATVSDAGLVTVTGTGVTTIYALVLGNNNYVSSWAVCEVTVKPQKVSDVTVGAAGANGVPVLTAKNAAGETLSEGTDYEIQYVDANEQPKTVDEMRQHPGEYTAVVTFVGNYQGIVNKQVTVTAGLMDSDDFIAGLLDGSIKTGAVDESNAQYDVNGDLKVDIADLQALMNLKAGLNADGSQPSASRAALGASQAPAVLSIVSEEQGGGVVRYTLSLEAGRPFSAFMIDVVTTGSAVVAGEQSALQLRSGLLDGRRRIIGLADGTAEGQVLTVDVMGEGSVSFEGISFSTADATSFGVQTAGATAISGVSAATAGADIFGLNGQRRQTLQKGVSIVRGQDGRSVKVLRK
jgi:hypothetical protein